jgi:hypothetical protein
MDLHTQQRVAHIRSTHQPTQVRVRRDGRFAWWRNLISLGRAVCTLCRQPMPCRQLNWCDDVEAGRIEAVGWRP